MSQIDHHVNKAIYVIFLLDVILVTISALLLMAFERNNFSNLYYLGYQIPGVTPSWVSALATEGVKWVSQRTTFIQGWLTYIVLYNNFIPISMYVTLEMVTYVHLFFVNEDLEMYHAPSDTPAKARSPNITDLGQIDFVFSDKTGTLTQNVMKFKRCSVNGVIYGAPVLMTATNTEQDYLNINQVPIDASQNRKLDTFCKILALCHTVVVERETVGSNTKAVQAPSERKYEYQAESPDEKALVEAARDLDYELTQRTNMQMTISALGRETMWTPLAVNKFDSDRKRMSIVLRDPKGGITMFCKGADSHMLNRGVCDSPEEEKVIVHHLAEFAKEGLRTLVFGMRNLTTTEFDAWNESYKKAAMSKNR